MCIRDSANRIGEADYNKDLSYRRAKAVRKELINNGLDPELTKAIGYGQSFPILSKDPRLALDMSRRVDFLIQ